MNENFIPKPEEVFRNFFELCKIPHGSGNEKEISDYLVEFARNRGLEVIQDEALNVIIKKPATFGYEKAPTVILQGHMDMVCEKNADKMHDFLKDPLSLKINGNLLTADGTTLGGDDGIAVAYCMALLESSDIPHPALEVLITTDEENGMTGAMKVSKDNLKGSILINIDSEEDDEFLVSCAGGTRCNVIIKKISEDIKYNSAFRLTVKGLRGGHSGMDINKNRGNSNKLLARLLEEIEASLGFRIINIYGGGKANAIPRESTAVIHIENDKFEQLKKIVDDYSCIFLKEFPKENTEITLEKIEGEFTPQIDDVKREIINILRLLPNGVQSMHSSIENLVESSVNPGVILSEKDDFVIMCSVRSSTGSIKEEIAGRIKILSDINEAEFERISDYPAWEYKEKSYIRDLFIEVYKDKFNVSPKISAIHAGLECGLFTETLGDLDMISMGPNLHDVHTPDESLEIESTGKVWDFLKEVLKKIK